jgi:ABC-type Na+ efflux pump permease subunit
MFGKIIAVCIVALMGISAVLYLGFMREDVAYRIDSESQARMYLEWTNAQIREHAGAFSRQQRIGSEAAETAGHVFSFLTLLAIVALAAALIRKAVLDAPHCPQCLTRVPEGAIKCGHCGSYLKPVRTLEPSGKS